jgi:hypothetical protein
MSKSGYRWTMRRFILVPVLACTLAGVAGTARTPTLTGHLRVAAAEPTCTATGCGAPLISYTLAFRRAGKTHFVRTLPKTGTFRAVLAPGTYTVTVTDAPDARLIPGRVAIKRGTTTRVTLTLVPSQVRAQ